MKARIPHPRSHDLSHDADDGEQIIVEDTQRRQGFVMLPHAIVESPLLSNAAKIAYALLLKYARQDGSCYPGQERMARDLGVSRNAVSRYIAELAATGAISVKRRGQGKTNLYTLPVLHGPNKPPREDREYFVWRRAVNVRDVVCQDCGATTNLHAHHILHWHSHPKARYDVANGVLVCAECHRKRHPEIPLIAWRALQGAN